MKRSRFSGERIAHALRQVEGGGAVVDVRRQMGVSEATFDLWTQKYAHLGASEIGSCGSCARSTRS